MLQTVVIATSGLVTFAAIILFYHHHIQGWVTSKRSRFFLLGVMLGLGASFMMLHPIEQAPGIIFDTRHMFVGFAGLLGGGIGAVSALVIATATRMALAGAGMPIGILVLVTAAAIGILAHTFIDRIRLHAPWSWAAFGLLLSLSLSWILLLPDPMRSLWLRDMAPILIAGNVIGAVAAGYLLSSVSEAADQRHRAVTQSRMDDLTGILNRRGLNMEYHSAVSRRTGTGVALLTIDLDHFKQVNDSFGHVVGDHLLERVSGQINQLVRKDDIVARMGGDEFVVVLTNTTKETAESTAERLHRAISEGRKAPESDRALQEAYGIVTASIGVAFSRTPPEHLEDLLAASDKLLYIAKQNGRDRVIAAEVPPSSNAPRIPPRELSTDP